MPQLKALVLLIVGGGLLVGAIVTGIAKRGFIHRAHSVPGVVSRLNAGGSHPEVEFTTATGKKVSYPQGGFIFGYHPGQNVRVLYSPENPKQTACIDSVGALWFVPIVLFCLSLALIIGGAASLFSAPSASPQSNERID